MPWEQCGGKISKGEVLKMLLDLKHTKKMPRTGTENERTPGFACVVYCAFEVVWNLGLAVGKKENAFRCHYFRESLELFEKREIQFKTIILSHFVDKVAQIVKGKTRRSDVNSLLK